MDLRSKFLKSLYILFPFSLNGDIQLGSAHSGLDLSCVINFYGRINLLEGVLHSLSEQDFPRDKFEVVLVEDRGGTEEGRQIARRFAEMLNIRYFPLSENFGRMGYSRNYGLSQTRGRYILFLDDDTVILQKDFLSGLVNEFISIRADGIVPFGCASYCLLKGRYSFHDPYYPTNRCMAYTRQALSELGGFVSEIVGQEDVEFVIRFVASRKSLHKSERLSYMHPPLLMNSLNKAVAVGASFTGLKRRYPLPVWLMLLFNGSRYLPLLAFPLKTKWQIQGKFSLGFLCGIIRAARGKSVDYA